MHLTRREFLLQTGQACLGYALGAAAFTAGVARFSLINAFAQGADYRALVCVFLAGGNDGNNTVVPLDSTGYNAYASVRSASGLAIAQDALLPITPTSIGSPYGLHPSLAALQTLMERPEAVGGMQRGSIGAADHARAVPERRPATLSALFALRPDRAVAVGDRRPCLADRVGWPHRRPDERASIGIPDRHQHLGRACSPAAKRPAR